MGAEAYSHANWATSTLDRKSISSYVVTLAGSPYFGEVCSLAHARSFVSKNRIKHIVIRHHFFKKRRQMEKFNWNISQSTRLLWIFWLNHLALCNSIFEQTFMNKYVISSNHGFFAHWFECMVTKKIFQIILSVSSDFSEGSSSSEIFSLYIKLFSSLSCTILKDVIWGISSFLSISTKNACSPIISSSSP